MQICIFLLLFCIFLPIHNAVDPTYKKVVVNARSLGYHEENQPGKQCTIAQKKKLIKKKNDMRYTLHLY